MFGCNTNDVVTGHVTSVTNRQGLFEWEWWKETFQGTDLVRKLFHYYLDIKNKVKGGKAAQIRKVL